MREAVKLFHYDFVFMAQSNVHIYILCNECNTKNNCTGRTLCEHDGFKQIKLLGTIEPKNRSAVQSHT